MKKELEEHFKEKYNLDGFEYFTEAFNIGDYFEALTKLQEFTAKKALIDDYIATRGWSEDDYKQRMESGSVERDMPTQAGEGLCCMGSVPLDLNVVNEELEKYKAEVD